VLKRDKYKVFLEFLQNVGERSVGVY